MAGKKSATMSNYVPKDGVKSKEQEMHDNKGAVISKKSFRGKKKPQCV